MRGSIADSVPSVSLREATPIWARVALLSFGGPAGQIAVMHRILVEEKKWISERRFLHALNYCMLLPGPEAHQLAVYIGWLMHRTWGGIVSGALFVLPGLVSLGILSWIYFAYGQVGLVASIFFGLKAAVLAVVLDAVIRIGKRALRSHAHLAIAGTAFVAIFAFSIPFPLIVLAAGIAGFVGDRSFPHLFVANGHRGDGHSEPDGLIDAQFARAIPEHVRPSLLRLCRTVLLGVMIWLGPLAVMAALLGMENVFTAIAVFNSKMAMVTFGGAYAVLTYMAQQAVEHFHWLRPDEMLVGLGFAETTPGPLISVVQFVGFLAAARQPGALDPVLAGTLGGVLAMWTTFVPSFLWIFLGGPYVEALIGNRTLNAALTAITAAVVGVILNLAAWLALHTLFRQLHARTFSGITMNLPVLSSIDLAALVIALGAIVALFRFKLGVVPVLLASCAAGVFFHLTVSPGGIS